MTQEVATSKRVEAGDRFVEDDQFRPLGDGDGQGELGALPAGELARPLSGVETELFDTGLREPGIPAGFSLAPSLR